MVRARTTSFEVKKGETTDIPVLVTSKTANLFEIWIPIGGGGHDGTCPGGYVDAYPGRGDMYVGSTIQVQLMSNYVGQCSTTLNVTLYINHPANNMIVIEEFSIPITITVTK